MAEDSTQKDAVDYGKRKETPRKSMDDDIFGNFEAIMHNFFEMEKEHNRKLICAFVCGIVLTVVISRVLPRR